MLFFPLKWIKCIVEINCFTRHSLPYWKQYQHNEILKQSPHGIFSCRLIQQAIMTNMLNHRKIQYISPSHMWSLGQHWKGICMLVGCVRARAHEITPLQFPFPGVPCFQSSSDTTYEPSVGRNNYGWKNDWTIARRMSRVPDYWRRANIVPIFKWGKMEEAANYRPIILIWF